ncbi:MAG: hypothetical protein ACLQPD_23465 [Desulfomonilaceae bacterium]
MNIIDFAFPRRVSKTNYLADKMAETVRPGYNDRGIVTGKKYWPPMSRVVTLLLAGDLALYSAMQCVSLLTYESTMRYAQL